ncbi:MAG: hypothetical protein ACYTDX_01470 [Planctomycetota bacterium]|jgi:hypothetical protein
MLKDEDRIRLERLLELGDRLNRLQRAIDDEMSGRRPEGSVRDRMRRSVEQLAEDGVLDSPLPGYLGRMERRRRFSREEVLVLLLMISRRIQWGEEGLTGREILEVIFDTSFGILDGAEILEEGAPLRATSALQLIEGTETSDVLDQWYLLSEKVFRAIRREMRRTPRRRTQRKAPVRAYRDHREHLMDLARLTAQYQRRAYRLFGPPPEMDDARQPMESVDRVLERVRECEERIHARLEASESSAGFPILRMARANDLSLEEVHALAILLFQEVYTGSSYLPVVDVVKALSSTEEELIEKRALFRREAPLIAGGLVVVDEEPVEREYSSEAYLPGWVVDELLSPGPKHGITREVRQDFASYLDRLKDSGQFFRDLGEPEPKPAKKPPARKTRGRKERGGGGRGRRGKG